MLKCTLKYEQDTMKKGDCKYTQHPHAWARIARMGHQHIETKWQTFCWYLFIFLFENCWILNNNSMKLVAEKSIDNKLSLVQNNDF